MKQLFKSFTRFEIGLWIGSVVLIVGSVFLSNQPDYLTLAASLIGATALIFVSKGHVLGQFLTVVFAVFYGIISFSFGYYGEMMTYLGMTAPIAVASIVTWLRNPYHGNKAEVTVNSLRIKEILLMSLSGFAVTVGFYFLLRFFHTTNLILSTVSVFTSFVASYLTMRRSEYYAIGYALNDLVLIALWILASIENLGYVSMVVCFAVFLVNDLYGFINWSKIKRRQAR